ncbi:hypothetical protein AMTRI_Chr05g59800 [Amborella trichopoda]
MVNAFHEHGLFHPPLLVHYVMVIKKDAHWLSKDAEEEPKDHISDLEKIHPCRVHKYQNFQLHRVCLCASTVKWVLKFHIQFPSRDSSQALGSGNGFYNGNGEETIRLSQCN